MPSERARIDRRLAAAPPTERVVSAGTEATFRDEWGGVIQEFDVSALGLPDELTALFADAFRMQYAGAAPASRKSCWKALRTFAAFVAEDGNIDSPADLDSSAVGRYILWLDRRCSPTGRPWSISTRYGRYAPVKAMLAWALRNRAGRLPARLVFPHSPFPGRHRPSGRRRLSTSEIKAILRACHAEIDEAWNRFETGQTILTRTPEAPALSKEPGLEAVLRDLHRLGQGVMPWFGPREAHGGPRPALEQYGGRRLLAQHLHLTVDTLTPFFLAIAIQTAANPDALRHIGRKCVAPHPLDEHRAIIDWAKPRAGGAVRRAQRRSFDRRRRYAAPNLIDKVLAMTAPLVPHAPPGERDRLFLVRGNRPSGVGVIGNQTLNNSIRRFVARANERIEAWNEAHPDRLRALLPHFVPVLFRGSVASLHYHAAGGDIRAAQAVLNHARTDTTDLYVRGPETQRLQEATVARLQKLMIAWITGGPQADDPADADPGRTLIALGRNAATLGHVCANPLAGAASGARPGHLCPAFGGCLACPGLVIPIDAEHLARVLQAKRHLERARDRIDPRRWQLLYAPSYRILAEDVLPDFPAGLHAAAERRIAALPPLPDLE